MTRIPLKTICDQLTDALSLEKPLKVAGLIEDDGTVSGWTIVSIAEDGKMTPVRETYETIKDLFIHFNPKFYDTEG